MMLRLVGAAMVVFACGGFGFFLAREYRREEALLRELLRILGYMESELSCRGTALPELCLDAAALSRDTVGKILQDLSVALERMEDADATACMTRILTAEKDLPDSAKHIFQLLGATLGRFDYNGQMQELAAVKQLCAEKIDKLAEQRDIRIRNYQTLGICAGVALAILLL